jgi:hypothetical protein
MARDDRPGIGAPAARALPTVSPAWAVAICIVIGLLGLNTFLAWRTLDENDEPVAAEAAPAATAEPPPLPPSTRSTEDLLRDVESSATAVVAPLADVRRQLGAAIGQLGFIEAIPGLLDQIASNTRGFDTVPPGVAELSLRARQLLTVRATLAGIRDQIGAVERATARFRDVAVNVKSMRKLFSDVRRSVGALEGTAVDTFPELLKALRAMAADVGRIRECTERPVVCQGGP